jgi:serine protease inhibitor
MAMLELFLSPSIAGGADFSGMFDSKDPDDQIKLLDIVHESVIEVNEKGNEAAAFSGPVAATDGPRREMISLTPTFNADRPLVFLVKENAMNTILFIGRHSNPVK